MRTSHLVWENKNNINHLKDIPHQYDNIFFRMFRSYLIREYMEGETWDMLPENLIFARSSDATKMAGRFRLMTGE